MCKFNAFAQTKTFLDYEEVKINQRYRPETTDIPSIILPSNLNSRNNSHNFKAKSYEMAGLKHLAIGV